MSAHEHDLIVVYSARGSDLYGNAVVRWCRDCGAIVVDKDVDGRTYPGAVAPMQFPAMNRTPK